MRIITLMFAVVLVTATALPQQGAAPAFKQSSNGSCQGRDCKIAIVDSHAALEGMHYLQHGVAEAEARRQMQALFREYSATAHLDALLDVSSPSSPVLWASSGVNITKEIIAGYDAGGKLHNGEAVLPATKVGIINIQGAIVQCAEGQRDFDILQKQFAPKRAELESLKKEIDDLQTQLTSGDGNVRSDLQARIDHKKASLQRTYEDANKDFQSQQDQIANRIVQKQVKVLDEYAKANKFDIILDTSTISQNPQQLQNATLVGSLRFEDFAGQDITLAIIGRYDNQATALAPVAAPVALLKLPSTYVSAQNQADELQLNSDNSFSLQEGGQPYHGTFVLSNNTIELTIRETGAKTTLTRQGDNLVDSSAQKWTLREPSADATPSVRSTSGTEHRGDALHNADIVKLVKVGIDDATIIKKNKEL